MNEGKSIFNTDQLGIEMSNDTTATDLATVDTKVTIPLKNPAKKRSMGRTRTIITAIQRTVSLKLCLPMFILLLIGVPLVLVLAISFLFSRSSIQLLSLQLQAQTTDITFLFVDQLMDPARPFDSIAVEMRSQALSSTLDKPLDRELLWGHVMNSQSTKTAIYVTQASGNFLGYEKYYQSYLYMTVTPESSGAFQWYYTNPITGGPAEFISQAAIDPRSFLSYTTAVARKGLYFTKVYKFIPAGQTQVDLGFTASLPVYMDPYDTNSQFIGVVSCAYSLNTINNFLSLNKVTPNSQTFIIELDGSLIASSADSIATMASNGTLERVKCQNSKNSLVSSTCRKLLGEYGNFLDVYGTAVSSSNGILHQKLSDNLIIVVPFQYNGIDITWMFVNVVPEDDYLAQTRTNTYALLGIVIPLIVIVMLLVFFFSWCLIVYPLKNFAIQMGKVSQLNLEGVTESQVFFYELSVIQKTFHSMLAALETFRKFMPAAITKRATNSDINDAFIDETELTPQYVTLFHLNITDFGRLSEQLLPDDLKTLIKETYDALGQVLLKSEATIDRFIGDYVFAMFNAPLPIENPERKACDAALKCKAVLSEKQIEWIQKGISDLECRIGIHADVALIGAIGSDPHLNYTAMGASVSLTTSLESLNKFYKTGILISDDVYQKVHDYFICRVVDIVRFNGNTENRKPTRCSMTLYELLDYREHRSPEHLILIEKWTLEWKKHWESGNVEEALHCIDEALKIEDFEKDHTLLMQKKRCHHYLQNPDQVHLSPTLV